MRILAAILIWFLTSSVNASDFKSFGTIQGAILESPMSLREFQLAVPLHPRDCRVNRKAKAGQTEWNCVLSAVSAAGIEFNSVRIIYRSERVPGQAQRSFVFNGKWSGRYSAATMESFASLVLHSEDDSDLMQGHIHLFSFDRNFFVHARRM